MNWFEHVVKRARRALVPTLIAVGMGVVVLLGAAWFYPAPERLERRDSTVVTYRDGRAAHVFLAPDDRWRVEPELRRIDDDYIRALVALEDERFWSHPGVDPIAVVRAAISNLRHGRIVSGASTITMQLIRLSRPRPRTFRSKVIEAFEAFSLELQYSKEEILEAYLRFVPFGHNLEGIPAASYAYFGHPPDALAPAEIATLLAVPQSPPDHHPDPDHVETLERARNHVADRLLAEDALPRGQRREVTPERLADQIRNTRVPDRLQAFPREVPHAAYWLKARFPERERIETTLDGGLQARVRKMVRAHRAEAYTRDIHNTAAVVVEHETGALRALVGNFEFFEAEHGNRIPSFAVPRSTGSLLKPFIYGLALERGLAGPRHLVRDVPIRYGSYRPENYNGRYSGLVRLEEALAQSLNVPFVNLAAEIGVDEVLNTMRHLGARHLRRDPSHYRLSVAVGGIQATPLETASAYATLARGGTPPELHLRRDEPLLSRYAKRVYGRGTVWLIRRALSRRDRPDFPERHRMTADGPTIAWKTGTSAGHRDAWTAGYGDRYTASVWMGNVDNTSSPSLVGSQAAAPLFFDIIEAIDTPPERLPSPPRDVLSHVEVCSYSGHLPDEACPHTDDVWLPTHNVPTEECPYHVRVPVDRETGRALTPTCRDNYDSEMRTFIAWPSGVQRWMSDRGGDVPTMPPYAPNCQPNATGHPPEIVSPPADGELVLIPGVPLERQELPLEADTPRATELSWFVDGQYIGSTSSRDRLWWTPETGRHEFVVVDEAGLKSRRTLEVR